MNSFEQFKENNLSTASKEALSAEITNREREINPFPFHVFHPNIKPYIAMLHEQFDLPKSYIGLILMSCYSSAIGSSYTIEMGIQNMYMSVWACLEGISSSGKSVVINSLYAPLKKIQAQFDKDWQEDDRRNPNENKNSRKLNTVLFKDVHISTLTRSVMPDNPKGLTKDADEILEFINGMNALSRKEGTDEQFWISAWDGGTYSGIRANKDKFVIPRVFINVYGGIQPSVVYKLFKNDRGTTGFIFRVLFATTETNKIANPNLAIEIPIELVEIHHKCITKLYVDLEVNDVYKEPKKLNLDEEALSLLKNWKDQKIKEINSIETPTDMEIQSSIFGKISAYALRFSGILCISDRAYDEPNLFFRQRDTITANHMARAIELANYFFNSALELYKRVNTSMYAPEQALRFAAYLKKGFDYQKIGDLEYINHSKPGTRRQKANRDMKKYILEYPNIFGAKEK